MGRAPPFHSARLVYRAYTSDDSKLLEEMFSDPVSVASGESAICVPVSPSYLSGYGQGASKSSLVCSVICLPLSAEEPTKAGTAIGWVLLGPKASAESHHRTTNIGLMLSLAFRGKGYAVEAVAWMMGVAFERCNLHKVELEVLATNVAARKVYEKCHFELEGLRKRNFWTDGEWHDTALYGLLADDWRAAQDVAQASE